jgi:hypothetical protein
MRKTRNEKYNRETQQEWGRPLEVARKCGIKKSRLYELLIEANGKIETCILKIPGASRGARPALAR